MRALEALKEKGIKITKARIIIYEILTKNESSVTVDFLYDECRRLGLSLNISTVYRTLEIFEEKKIVERFYLGEGRYSFAIKKNHHVHKLECSLCHKEIEVACPMQHIGELLKTQTGFTLTEHKLDLKGICEECKHKEK